MLRGEFPFSAVGSGDFSVAGERDVFGFLCAGVDVVAHVDDLPGAFNFGALNLSVGFSCVLHGGEYGPAGSVEPDLLCSYLV